MTTFFLIAFLLSLTFFILGAIIGWLTNRHLLESSPSFIHPEMFDQNGNIIPDEILAIRFENGMDDDEEELL
jgi:hypothetical protein